MTEVEGGQRLLDGLAAEGVEVRAAFWAKPTDDRGWQLYIATPAVNEDLPVDPYRAVHDVLRRTPDLWLDSGDVRLIGADDTMCRDAAEVVAAKLSPSPHAGPRTKPYPGLIRFNGSNLGGTSMDGVYIYPYVRPPIPA